MPDSLTFTGHSLSRRRADVLVLNESRYKSTRPRGRRMDRMNLGLTLLFLGKVYAIVVRVLGRN
jgi:hypothetical protein